MPLINANNSQKQNITAAENSDILGKSS